MRLDRGDATCFALAAIFSAVVVIPGVLIFADRSLPFTYVDYNIVEKAVEAGGKATFRLTIKNVTKTCAGRVDRAFVDAAGRVWPMASQRTAYQHSLDRDGAPVRLIDREVEIPEGAAPGEGTYIGEPRFWCYPLQHLHPIPGPTMRARVIVLPKGQYIAPGSGVTLSPKGKTVVVTPPP